VPAPRYQALVDSFAADIRAGRLAPGTRLPTHRQLAASSGIALVTATRVYASLEALGLVSREQGRGTFVRSLPADHGIDMEFPAGDVVDLNFNYPSVPGQADLLRQALRELAGSGDLEALLRYQPHAGRPSDRAVIGGYLGAPASQVLIVNGAQQGLAITLMALLQPGDRVAVDPLTYPGFKVLAETLHLQLVPSWPPDRPVRAVYVPGVSDLDLVALTSAPIAVEALTSLHRDLDSGIAAGDKLGCVYVPVDAIPDRAAQHPTWTHGQLVHRILSGVSRAELSRHGFAVFGRPPSELFPPVSAADIRAAAVAELTGYWAWAARRPWIWLDPEIAELGLTSMARGRHALRHGDLLTKTDAIRQSAGPPWLRAHLTARRRGEPTEAPRWRTAWLAWRDARRTVAEARRT